MGCAFSSSDEAAASRRSKEIDRQIKEQFENSHKDVKLLLLGKLIMKDQFTLITLIEIQKF